MSDEGKPTLGAGKWALGAGAVLLSQLALAVGMGELQLHSAMEERLVAEIDLLNIGDLNEHQMAVRLASPEDFENAGIDRDFRLSELRFQVSLDNPQRPVIRISSRQPIHEPYLNFLIELRWPSGRLLREYTALLDLPTFSGAPALGKTSAAALSGAAAELPGTATRTAPVHPQRSAPRRGAASALPAAVASDGRIQVRAGDTLWSIAQRARVPGATTHQAMQAIAAANPDAFIGGNVNLIRRDAWLQMPDAAAMRAADASRLGLSKPRPATAPPALESRSGAPAVPADRVDGELKLTSATDTVAVEGATGGQGKGSTGTDPGLAGALEERDRLQRENDELKNRVQSLEAQLGTTSRLAEIEAPGVAALQEQSATVPGASPEAVPETAGTVPAEAPAADAAAAVETPPQEPVTAAVPDAPEPTTVAVPPAEAPTPAPADQSAAAAPKGPLAAIEAFGDWALPALGAALILGLLALVGLRRRSGVQQRGLALPGEKEVVPRNLRGAEPDPEPEPTHEELFAAPAQVEELESILNEAEVCLSFGNEEQAEELLRDSLDKYPQDTKLHLKLLAVLVARADRAGFDAHLPKLAALGDLAAFAEAQTLQGRFADDAPASWELPESTVRASETATQELAADVAEAKADFDEVTTDFAEAPTSAEPIPSTSAPASVLADVPLDDFDLNLELDLPSEAPAAAQAAPALAVDDSTLEAIDLENFDLGFDQVEPVPAESPATALGATQKAFDASFDDLELFQPGQELATQLELARAYVDMGDVEGAREILDHVAAVGDATQRETARELLARLG